MKYLAACYAGTGRISVPLEAIRLKDYFHAEDMAQWSMELLSLWHEANSDSKMKWVLPLCAYRGDSRIVTLINDMVANWPIMGRAAIACEAVRVLAVSDKDEALRLVDGMSRNYKSRPVKLAAEQAFAYAANEQGIDSEELADRIIPDLGFSQCGELVLSLGERTFILRLNERFERIRNALLYIQHHFREPLSLANAADYAGLSANYFSECFRRQVGISFQDYLNESRLQFASALLRSSELPVTEVCFAAGFNTISHFDRIFKRKFGCSPREYRKHL
ncbi:helix-turn-helix transcriptional regulator [Paenibacillus harenae]|uniref:helix-turn-helix transcriptional regulator n=1 Tax=Paenibacillus harenae TaxID=306543 RepID=UPI000490BB9E|nr:AraC family transcriptional regulator [Paenibacillus harenae]